MIGKNNPLNVRYSPLNRWKGLTGQTKGFCDFVSIYYGLRAAFYLISVSYKKKGILTYKQIIERYAPPTENNSADYVVFICNRCNVFPFDVPKTDDDWINLIHYMSVYEGNTIDKVEIKTFLYIYKNCY